MQLLENNTITIDDFVLLLDDRTFVDYFNIYQSLPIFGQHVIYKFIEREFSYEPPIRKRGHYIDRREVVRWLCTERFPGFTRSCLYLEYILCNKLRDIDINLSEKDDPADRSMLTRNVLGNALGMQLFRDSLKGTPGEKCYKCWYDLERLQRTPPGKERKKLTMYIKNMYLVSGAPFELETPGKHFAFEGRLNFALIPEAKLQEELLQAIGDGFKVYQLDSEDAFQNLQHIILCALKIYWVPRYLLNVVRTIPKKFLAVLKRETPYDRMALNEQRQTRCRQIFPIIYGSASPRSPSSPTKVIESTVEGEMREVCDTPSSAESESSSELSYFITEAEERIRPSDLLTISGGGRLEPKEEEETIQSPSSLDFGSADPRESELSCHSFSVETKVPSYTKVHSTLTIPPSLFTYISGRKRLKTGHRVNNKVMCALAADKLAGNPLLSFLGDKGKDQDQKLLQFWTDVRQYLKADETHQDEFGHSIKRQLAHTIFNRYLSASSGCDDIFTENMKMKIFTSLSNHDDASLLWFVQDFVTGILKDTWKTFMSAERKRFRRLVCGEKQFDKNLLDYNVWIDGDSNDPLFFLNSTRGISPELFSGDYRPKSGSTSASSRTWSRLSDPHTVSLTDEQIMKAFEFTVILAEYGRSEVFSYRTPSVSDTIDVIYSDYGTLHINQHPVVRNNFLHRLMHKPKIDIANLKVSKLVLLDTGLLGIEGEKHRANRMVLRRDGIVIDRPQRPRTFAEVLTSHLHFEFFKRFMYEQKMPYPLAFWKQVDDLKDMPADRIRQNIINNIIRKYFSKQGALLDCTDDLIQQIPSMERVPLSVLICAQASVFRSMERKWYPKYLETYPIDADLDILDKPVSIPVKQDVKVDKIKQRQLKRKKTFRLWNMFVSAICGFLRAMKDASVVQLLEIYLKKEIQKKQSSVSSKQELDKNFPVTGSTTMFHTRVVLRNRLVIVDKLPMDLKFWCQVTKYIDQVENFEKLERMSIDNMNFLYQKARSIASYYLESDIPPRNQINVPSDLARTMVSSLEKEGPTRGVFHDALMLIFPLLYHYWRQCEKEWLGNRTAAEMLTVIEHEEKAKPQTPHKFEEVPDFMKIRSSQIKVITHSTIEDDQFIINFSLYDGCKLILPQPKVPKASKRTSIKAKTSRRNIKESNMKIRQTSPRKDKVKEKTNINQTTPLE